ncbi:hypothetical protein [Pseudescherichia sp. L3]|uniref:hypothetical protein n=1 Tax=Pseudescherichia sp. L3 TaxID=2970817 RepID=UPI00214FE672|nr:hypothetical protein [Pseudescherichia sp. L3]MCR4457611.1 hypothetical protein [Pseudescherichia sp. L3]
MLTDNDAKIAYVYSSLIEPGVVVGDPTPGIGLRCERFPTDLTLSINFGVIGFNGIDNYSIEFHIIYENQDVTIESQESRVLKYLPQWGSNGEFVADMCVFENFTANGPGYYFIDAHLLFKDTNPESVWEVIDIKKSCFAISAEWRREIDG